MNPRLLPLVGAYNFRDLGGYRTTDGRLTRWGQLFRSDTLSGLTEADLEILREIGLAAVIDLRSAKEVQRSGRGRMETEPAHYLHASILEKGGDGASSMTQKHLAERYLWFLEVGRDALVDALMLIGNPSKRPLVFHCEVGKDRTGVLAALVLDILRVEPEIIVDDYVLTASRMELILARIRDEPNGAKRMAELPEFVLQAEAATMQTFLDLLHEQHGGGREWALAAGVPEQRLNAMSTQLVSSEMCMR